MCICPQLLHKNKYPLRGRDLFWICWEVRLVVLRACVCRAAR